MVVILAHGAALVLQAVLINLMWGFVGGLSVCLFTTSIEQFFSGAVLCFIAAGVMGSFIGRVLNFTGIDISFGEKSKPPGSWFPYL